MVALLFCLFPTLHLPAAAERELPFKEIKLISSFLHWKASKLHHLWEVSLVWHSSLFTGCFMGTFPFLISSHITPLYASFLSGFFGDYFFFRSICFCISDSVFLEFPLPLVPLKNSPLSVKAQFKCPLLHGHYLVHILFYFLILKKYYIYYLS